MDITTTRSKRRNTLFPNALLLKKFAQAELDEDDEDVELPDFLNEEEEIQEDAKEKQSKKPKIAPKRRSSSMSSQSSDENKDPTIQFANKHMPGRVPSNVPFGFSLSQPQTPVKPKPSKKVPAKSTKTKKTQPKKTKAVVPKRESSKESSSSTTDDFSKTVEIADALRNVENRIQINLNNIRQKDEVRLSIRDIHCEIKSRLGDTQSKSEQTDYSIVTESYIQKLKNEINMSRAQPDVDGSNTDVKELKSEINQYKKLLKCGCTPVDSANFVSVSTSPVVLKIQSGSACQEPCKGLRETGRNSINVYLHWSFRWYLRLMSS